MPLDPAIAGQLKAAGGIISATAGIVGGVVAGLGLMLLLDNGGGSLTPFSAE
ncbi:MAG: hypothetical protein L0H59_10585 [Tomitella sp.]|nr:hypothetical protein [Tomitella sp.]